MKLVARRLGGFMDLGIWGFEDLGICDVTEGEFLRQTAKINL